MYEKDPRASVNSEETFAEEENPTTPHFDEDAVKQARPAVPLSHIRARQSRTTGAVVIAAILGGLALGAVGASLLSSHLKRNNSQANQTASQNSPEQQPASADLKSSGENQRQA